MSKIERFTVHVPGGYQLVMPRMVLWQLFCVDVLWLSEWISVSGAKFVSIHLYTGESMDVTPFSGVQRVRKCPNMEYAEDVAGSGGTLRLPDDHEF